MRRIRRETRPCNAILEDDIPSQDSQNRESGTRRSTSISMTLYTRMSLLQNGQNTPIVGRLEAVMTQPNERTQAIVFAYEFLCKLAKKRIPGVTEEMQSEATWLLRHFPQPYEIRIAAQSNPTLFAEPESSYLKDSTKLGSVGDLALLLARFNPDMRAVLKGSDGHFEDVQTAAPVSTENMGSAVLITGSSCLHQQ